MTLNHNQATAKVTVDGLALGCYNKDESKWDLAYLHHPHPPLHNLGLLVDNDLIVTNPPPFRISLIEFVAVNPQTPNYPGSPNGFFDIGRIADRRVDPAPDDDAAENFRWTINLEDQGDVPHGNVQLKKPPFRLTRAFINNGVFYTTALSPKNLLKASFTSDPHDDPNNMSLGDIKSHILGKTNDQIAADIFCAPADGKVIIKVDGVPVVELPHRPGDPWQISLTNLCPPTLPTGQKFEKGDFHLFYDVLNVTGQQHIIWGEPPTTPAPDARSPRVTIPAALVSGRADCDTVFMSTTQSLDPLFT
ncbi:MAG: hypothetical protein ACJ754_06270 [Pyrinomonadaceae bacterium]